MESGQLRSIVRAMDGSLYSIANALRPIERKRDFIEKAALAIYLDMSPLCRIDNGKRLAAEGAVRLWQEIEIALGLEAR
jgi:hypothetical protein